MGSFLPNGTRNPFSHKNIFIIDKFPQNIKLQSLIRLSTDPIAQVTHTIAGWKLFKN